MTGCKCRGCIHWVDEPLQGNCSQLEYGSGDCDMDIPDDRDIYGNRWEQ